MYFRFDFTPDFNLRCQYQVSFVAGNLLWFGAMNLISDKRIYLSILKSQMTNIKHPEKKETVFNPVSSVLCPTHNLSSSFLQHF